MQTASIPVVEAAKAELSRAVDRVKKAFETTPDDRIHWAPSPSARTPIQQVAHCANSLDGMMRWFQGEEFDTSDMQALDTKWREEEKAFTTRSAVLARLDETSNNFQKYLDGLTPEQVAGVHATPFGDFPMAEAITWPADHLRGHSAQMDYTQTCYGDLDWHF